MLRSLGLYAFCHVLCLDQHPYMFICLDLRSSMFMCQSSHGHTCAAMPMPRSLFLHACVPESKFSHAYMSRSMFFHVCVLGSMFYVLYATFHVLVRSMP